mmetsp:Transcript_19885/g.48247  ORF Transcript_19885/g.48247 Transcript_19885/m.48247 type:complete len:249 (+) Transcript_19885:663-1409(+)
MRHIRHHTHTGVGQAAGEAFEGGGGRGDPRRRDAALPPHAPGTCHPQDGQTHLLTVPLPGDDQGHPRASAGPARAQGRLRPQEDPVRAGQRAAPRRGAHPHPPRPALRHARPPHGRDQPGPRLHGQECPQPGVHPTQLDQHPGAHGRAQRGGAVHLVRPAHARLRLQGPHHREPVCQQRALPPHAALRAPREIHTDRATAALAHAESQVRVVCAGVGVSAGAALPQWCGGFILTVGIIVFVILVFVFI